MYSQTINCFVNSIFAVAAIIAIEAIAAIAAIFSFGAIFHQLTQFFCIRQIIADNEKNKFHAAIHKQ